MLYAIFARLNSGKEFPAVVVTDLTLQPVYSGDRPLIVEYAETGKAKCDALVAEANYAMNRTSPARRKYIYGDTKEFFVVEFVDARTK